MKPVFIIRSLYPKSDDRFYEEWKEKCLLFLDMAEEACDTDLVVSNSFSNREDITLILYIYKQTLLSTRDVSFKLLYVGRKSSVYLATCSAYRYPLSSYDVLRQRYESKWNFFLNLTILYTLLKTGS